MKCIRDQAWSHLNISFGTETLQYLQNLKKQIFPGL